MLIQFNQFDKNDPLKRDAWARNLRMQSSCDDASTPSTIVTDEASTILDATLGVVRIGEALSLLLGAGLKEKEPDRVRV